MATKEADTVEEERLKCSLCAKQHQKPKLLPCQHSVCIDCLMDGPINHQGDSIILECPRCHKPTHLPREGLDSLPSRLKSFITSLETCTHLPLLDKGMDSSQSIDASEAVCKEHLEKLSTYCATCQELVCATCTKESHRDHTCQEITEEQALKSTLQPIKLQLEALDEVIWTIEERHSNILGQGEAAEEKIRVLTHKLISLLEERKEKMVLEARKATEQKLTILSHQKEEALAAKQELQSFIEKIQRVMQVSSPEQLVVTKKELVDQIRMVSPRTSMAFIHTLLPAEDADIGFHEASGVADSMEIGFLQHSHIWQRCHVKGEGLKAASKNRIASFSLFVEYTDGSPILIPLRLIVCEIALDSKKQAIEFDIQSDEHNHPGRYDVKYMPLSLGMHQLSIRVGGENIHGSPFVVPVLESPTKTNEEQFHTVLGLARPLGVAVCKDGNIVVSESAAHRITLVDQEGKKLQSFGSKGTGEGQFHTPCGVAVTGNNSILVADSQNHRIQQLTMDGKFIASVGGRQEPLHLPTSVAVYPSGHIFVADRHQHITVFDENLKLLHVVEFKGSRSSRPKAISSIAFNSEGMIYVADKASGRVKVFDPSGNFSCQFEKAKNWNGQFRQPGGIAISKNTGTIFVTERDGHRVSKFTTSGQFLHSVGTKGSCPGQFNRPAGVTVDESGNVYICDSDNDRLVIF